MITDPRSPIAPNDVSRLAAELASIRADIKALQAPTGSQLAQTVANLTALVANINTTLNNYINNYSYTRAQIDARVLDPAQSGGNVATSASGRFNGGLASTDVYSHLLTYGGPYRAAYVHSDGTLGYVPSSRRFKRDIATAELSASEVAELRLVTFRYAGAVDELGDDAAVEVGLVAEEVDALPSLRWLVDYDGDGAPAGIRYDRLALALIARIDDNERRIARIETVLRNVG